MLSRRDLFSLAARTGVAGAALKFDLTELFAQTTAQDWGKGKLIRRSMRPPDYETPVSLLDQYITSNELHYLRSHLPIPAVIDPATFALKIDGEVSTPLSLSLAEIQKLPPVTLTVTLECAGNGRSFFDPPVAGVQWEKGAIGNARWTGARMSDVLKRAGIKTGAKNIQMASADRPLGTMPAFVRQVPLDKAMTGDTILAYQMNGQPIPQAHGAPLRVIVPGWEGAYSVKWVTGLTAIDKDSDSFWVASAYRYPVKRVAPGSAVDAKDMEPLKGLAVKSLITSPTAGANLKPGKIAVAGFAWAGDLDITKVEVSSNSGVTWAPAKLVGEQAKYAWRRFEFDFTATKEESYLIMSRATDSKGQVQPAVSHWNPSGYLWNQYDSVRIEIKGA